MARQADLLRRLASELAEATREVSVVHGEVAAQALACAIFLHHLNGNVRAAELVRRFGDRKSVRHLKKALDIAGIDALPEHLRSDEAAIYFYEHFLRALDPLSARRRGVHYTPPAVVSYIVRAVESILQRSFGESLTDAIIVDPCCGAGVFLKGVLTHCPEHPAALGMELTSSACAAASLLLAGCRLIQTDSLQQQTIETGGRTLVVLGNPPYSGHSANSGAIRDLLADYRNGLLTRAHGHHEPAESRRPGERNPKWLQDDYVKFIRVAQHWVEQAGRGIVAFITNHSYIFNPTFRAMRASLADTFDELYILDLHGSARLSEQTDAGDKDENVFPIRTGVAISLMVRSSGVRGCRIRYASIRGSRQYKLDVLASASLSDTGWCEISPRPPFHLFVPHSADLYEEYSRFPSLFEVFRRFSVGFVTSRDAFAVDFDRDALLERIADVRDDRVPIEQIREMYPVGDLDLGAFRKELREDPTWQDKAVSVLYRPFDRRWTYYSPTLMERPRLPFMENLMRPNVALAVGRAGQATGSQEWDVVFCTDRPADLNLFRRGGAMLFPRYVYDGDRRLSNMALADADADDVFHCIYALLYSSIYRRRYADFLRIDFPRVPVPPPGRLLASLAALGKRLMSVHLMRPDAFGDRPAPPNTAAIRIGGYELPRRYLEDRKKRRLTESDREAVDHVTRAISATIEIRRQIDEIVASDPPWEAAASRRPAALPDS